MRAGWVRGAGACEPAKLARRWGGYKAADVARDTPDAATRSGASHLPG
jgi:hypothetical protein